MVKLRQLPAYASSYEPETGAAQADLASLQLTEIKEIGIFVLAGVSVRIAAKQEGGGVREVPAATPAGEVETVALREVFAKIFPEDPQGAVSFLKQQVAGGSPRQAAAQVLLPYLASAGYGRQNVLIAALRLFAGPGELVRAALAVNRVAPDRGMLLATAGLLEHYGSAAWPALKELALSRRPECRYFARQIVECEGIPEEERREALAILAANPDLDTRWEVIELLDGGWLSDPHPVWQALLDDPNEQLQSIARSRLETSAP